MALARIKLTSRSCHLADRARRSSLTHLCDARHLIIAHLPNQLAKSTSEPSGRARRVFQVRDRAGIIAGVRPPLVEAKEYYLPKLDPVRAVACVMKHLNGEFLDEVMMRFKPEPE